MWLIERVFRGCAVSFFEFVLRSYEKGFICGFVVVSFGVDEDY